MQISEPNPSSAKSFALFALAFRPFFLLAGISAVFLLMFWILVFTQGWTLSADMPALYWHSHEMIFGYSSAVIAGFLLTAARNWTGVQTLTGKPLMLLVLVWLLARVLIFTPLDLVWLAAVDVGFFVLLALAVACPIVRVKQWNNFVFVPLLLLYALSNGLFYAELLWGLENGEEWGVHSGLGVIIVIISIMAGRVVGFFIERGVNKNVKNHPWANHLALWGSAVFMATQFILPPNILIGIAVLAAIGHLGRLIGWYHAAIWKHPLLWVLYLGYGWMMAGFALTALHLSGLLAESLAIHAFTVGTIGVMTLGMMARVALGHTGHAMQSHGLMNLAFLLINAAVIVRVILPLLLPAMSMLWIQLAGVLWVSAFMFFCWIYVPILIRARVDGQPG